MNVERFEINVPDEELADLRLRLKNTRWLEDLNANVNEGISHALLKRVVNYWADEFDWREQERRLNAFNHFKSNINGHSIHYIHQRGKGQNPMPLILTHGWPGSFVEMLLLIPLLTDPGAHGGDPADAFDVVIPSLPGYGFSSIPTEKGTGSYEVAALWKALMNGLGYPKFGAQGGDLGAGVSTWLAYRYPETVTGIHLNYIPGSYSPPLDATEPPVTEQEQKYLDYVQTWSNENAAYSRLQSTKPQSLAAGLNDSPAGLAAWITEKFAAWSDNHGNLESAVPLDILLTNISLYWFTRTIGSSFRMYVEGKARPAAFKSGERVYPPLGVALFPAELPLPPRSWVERGYNLTHWESMPAGGHFAALEQPQLLAADIRKFFRPLRK